MSEQSLPLNSSGSPTGVFPVEVWGCFLDTLLESGGPEETDVGLNLINSSTQLQKTFRKEKLLLAFRKVLPLLCYKCRWLKRKDMLRLRLVSKNFNRAIHIYATKMRMWESVDMDHIPRPEELEDEVDLHRFRLDKGFHFNPWHFFSFHMDFDTIPDPEAEIYKTVTEYKEDLDNCPEFPSAQVMKTVPLLALRSAEIDLIHEQMDIEGQIGKVWSFLNGIKSVFNRVGKHVWSLSFISSFQDLVQGTDEEDELRVYSCKAWKHFLKVLGKLRNLRHLRVKDFDMECNDYEIGPIEWIYPSLPKLESIEIYNTDTHTCAHVEVLNPLIHHFSSQLRRLSVAMFEAKYLKPQRFTKLVELEIGDCERNEDFDLVRRFLDNLPSPLVRLVLKFKRVSENETEVTLETEVLHWLDKFPNLESLLVYSGGVFIRETNPSPEAAELKSFPNLKFLRVEDGNGGLTFQFLRRFPSLQNLYVIANPFPTVWDNSMQLEGRITFRKELEEGRLYDSNCWEFLSELKTVTIQIPLLYDSYDYFHFNRERYERIKIGKKKAALEKVGRERGSHCESQPLRQDILEHLKYNWLKEKWLPWNASSTDKFVIFYDSSGSEEEEEAEED